MIYVLFPENILEAVASNSNELNVCTQSDIETLKSGWKIVECYCKDLNLKKDTCLCAHMFPVFSKGISFEQTGK